MPFVEPDLDQPERWRKTHAVDLRQVRATLPFKVYFLMRQDLAYTSREPANHLDPSDPNARWTAMRLDHVVQAASPERRTPAFRTDLASVPPPLWGVIASYGRQTLPAILHDSLTQAAGKLQSGPLKRAARRRADDIFLHTLMEGGVSGRKSWAMWAAVRMFGSASLIATTLLTGVVSGAAAWVAIFLRESGPWELFRWAAVAVAAFHCVVLVRASWETPFKQPPTLSGKYVTAPAYGSSRFRASALGSLALASLVTIATAPITVPLILLNGLVGVVLWEARLPAEPTAESRPSQVSDAWSPASVAAEPKIRGLRPVRDV